MEQVKILDLENDGLNLAVDGHFMYIRCKRTMYKYDLINMNLTAHNIVFKKDGKARGFSVCDKYIFLTDFCDLYILQKDDLQIAEVMRLGADLSSDLGVVRFGLQKAYIGVRNGEIAVMDIDKRISNEFKLSDASFWDFCVNDNCIYAGSVQGELIEINTGNMQITRKIALCKKNIYSVLLNDSLIYTVSQDMMIKATLI